MSAAHEPDPRLVRAPWRRTVESRKLFAALEADGRPARFVGGCVRDALLGLERLVWDVDVCTAEPPERVLDLLARAKIRAIPTGLRHGTVTALVGGQPFEVTTLRRDTATDGRHATVVFTDDFREDAARRDFTINAMSADSSGRLFDYFAGVTDLEQGRLRFVGDAPGRVREDYLRVFRFFRFYARYGRTSPDEATLAALRSGLPGLDRLSGERVQKETLQLLAAPDPRRSLGWMDDLGILAWLLDTVPDRSLVEAFVAIEPTPDALRRLAALLRASAADVAAFADRLKLSNADARRLERLSALPALDPAAVDDDGLRRALYAHERAGTEAAGLFGLAAAGGSRAEAEAWLARVGGFEVPVFPLAGRDVVALGVPAGPEVGALLAVVRDWWLDGGCTADEATLRARLQAEAAVR